MLEVEPTNQSGRTATGSGGDCRCISRANNLLKIVIYK